MEAGLAEDGFTLESVVLSDVLHPVDSYNLVKRTARTWPRIFTALPPLEDNLQSALETARSQFPAWETSRVAAALGLLNIHVFYRLDPAQLARGRVQGAGTRARLSSGHLMDIARSRYSGQPPIRPST